MRISSSLYKRNCLWLGRVIALVIASVTLVPGKAMATFSTTFHSFNDFNNTQQIRPSLTKGSDGNLYGTNQLDGANFYGSVYKITPSGTYTVLHSFSSSDPAGAFPAGTLVLGNDGNMYGTTTSTSTSPGCIFRITPTGTLTIVYSFSAAGGIGGFVQGSDGSFYGSQKRLVALGTASQVEIVKVTPAGVFSTLHAFSSYSDGCGDTFPLIQGSDGNLYGVMTKCGISTGLGGSGTIYKISPNGVFTVLFAFPADGTKGANPSSSLVQGSDGNYYGTTFSSLYTGTVFKILPTGTLTSLYSAYDFKPSTPLVQASNGSFYGANSDHVNGGIFNITTSGTFSSIFTFQRFSAPNGLAAQNIPYIARPVGNIVLSSDQMSIYGTGDLGGYDILTSRSGFGGIYRVSIGSSTGADLSISNASGSETSSGVSTYNFSVSNAGPEVATGTIFEFTSFPTGTTFVSSSGTCVGDAYTNIWDCSIGTIAAGSTVAISATSQTSPAAVFSPSFLVWSDVSDVNLNNNMVGITVSPPVVSLSFNHTSDTQTPSGLKHQLTITNAGPGIATNVTVSTTLPADTTLVTSASNAGCLQSGLQLTCSVGTINVGASYQLVVTLLNQSAPIIFTVSSTQTNLNAANNTYQDNPPGYGGDVPTLPQWGVVFLGLLLLVTSAKQARRQY